MANTNCVLIADPDLSARLAFSLLLKRRLGVETVWEAGDMAALCRILESQKVDILLVAVNLASDHLIERIEKIQIAHPGMRVALLSVKREDAALAEELKMSFVYKGELAEDVVLALQPLFIR